MTNDPDLERAYALGSTDDAKRLYAAWAENYDTDFGDAQGYLLPRHVVEVFCAEGGTGPVLDVGAGTGLVAEGLNAAGIGSIDGLDLSQEMLEIARTKRIYRDLFAADVTQPLSSGPYAGIVSAGTFTLGHVGPEGILRLLEITQDQCLFVISVNAAHFEEAGFGTLFESIGPRITGLRFEDRRIYSDKADLSHRYDMARLVSFRTL